MSSFDERAPEWDTPERRDRAAALAAHIREHVPLDRSTRAVEIGAGTGLLGLNLLADVASMTLTDPSAGMVSVARDKIAAEGIGHATAIVYDVPGEPPPGAPFDLAISLLVLHHIQDTEATLRSIRAMLAPAGRIALLDLVAEDGSFHDADAEGIEHHGFDTAVIARLAEQVGFRDVTTSVALEMERDGRRYPLFLLTGQRT